MVPPLFACVLQMPSIATAYKLNEAVPQAQQDATGGGGFLEHDRVHVDQSARTATKAVGGSGPSGSSGSTKDGNQGG